MLSANSISWKELCRFSVTNRNSKRGQRPTTRGKTCIEGKVSRSAAPFSWPGIPMWMNTHLIQFNLLILAPSGALYIMMCYFGSDPLLKVSPIPPPVPQWHNNCPQSLSHDRWNSGKMTESTHFPGRTFNNKCEIVKKKKHHINSTKSSYSTTALHPSEDGFYLHLLAMAAIAGCWVNSTIDSWVGFDCICICSGHCNYGIQDFFNLDPSACRARHNVVVSFWLQQ